MFGHSDSEKRLCDYLSKLDPAIVNTGKAFTTLYAYDATDEFHYPGAVIRPRSPEEIRILVEEANAFGIPVFPRGAGTGFSGGSLPMGGGVVVDLMGLSSILDFDEENMMIWVQPGIITAELQTCVEKRGLYYPPDPASHKTCTIGGNVAENAGGPHCLKYGVTRDYVFAIEGVTGAGRPFSAGKGVLKNRAGYDLRHLLIGSEGTLGIFSSILLKLIPKPEEKVLFAAFFKDFRNAVALVNKIMLRGVAPSSLEFMDEFALRAVENHAKIGLPTHYQALLLVEIDGRNEEISGLTDAAKAVLGECADEIRFARTPKEQESLWEIRRQASPAMRAFGNKKANEDIVVPRKHIPAAVEFLRNIAGELSLNIINFGHIGDGNIHVNIMYDQNDADEYKRVQEAIARIFSMVNGFKGAISGEHGIGISKKRYLPRNIDPVSYDLMRSIKRIFDPANIMNPHKMLY